MVSIRILNIILKLFSLLLHFKRTVPTESIFFIIHSYPIMHRITIVQNKIINIICSSLITYTKINLYIILI